MELDEHKKNSEVEDSNDRLCRDILPRHLIRAMLDECRSDLAKFEKAYTSDQILI